LELWSNNGVHSKFNFEIGVAVLRFGVGREVLELEGKCWSWKESVEVEDLCIVACGSLSFIVIPSRI